MRGSATPCAGESGMGWRDLRLHLYPTVMPAVLQSQITKFKKGNTTVPQISHSTGKAGGTLVPHVRKH